MCAPKAAFGQATGYSDLELATIERVVQSDSPNIDPAPVGKIIESIEIVRLDVFDEHDPVPDFVNLFHATTRERVIRRELLFEPGEIYEPKSVGESIRNLRALSQLSLVLIVPLRGSTNDRVKVLVIARDVWSLRLNNEFEYGNGSLNYLLLNPSEQNLFGTHTSVGALFVLEQDNYSVGGVFRYPRIAGSRLETSGSINFLFNRDTGVSEGSWGAFSYGQPEYSVTTKWSWQLSLAWLTEITRRYEGPTLRRFVASTGERVFEVYNTDRQMGEYGVTRSFGKMHRLDLTFGVEADRRRYSMRADEPHSPQAVREFETVVLPVSDTRLSPFVQVQGYNTTYLRTINFDTLALQEAYRTGYDVLLRIYPAFRAMGSTRNLLGVRAALGYTLAMGNGLARAIAANTIEFADLGRHDARLELGLRLHTPRLGFGRLLYDAVLYNRYEDYLNRAPLTLGGDNRLRGYGADRFRGNDLVASNLEFRTDSIDILSAQIGAAAFYDVGDAFDEWEQLKLKQGAGVGLRALFPQANRVVLRVDLGIPLSPEYAELPASVFVTFGQAFDTPSHEMPTVTGAVRRRP